MESLRYVRCETNGRPRRQLAVDHVTLRPLQVPDVNQVIVRLKVPAVRESFVPRFPENESELREYFTHPTREYFGIYYNDLLVGIVGGENIDEAAGKLEMKKLVGSPGCKAKVSGNARRSASFILCFHDPELKQSLHPLARHQHAQYQSQQSVWFRAGRSFPRRHQRRRQIPGHCAHGFVQTTLAANFFLRRLTRRWIGDARNRRPSVAQFEATTERAGYALTMDARGERPS
jgi:hypothetical protein